MLLRSVGWRGRRRSFVHLALDRLIHDELLRRDVAAYVERPLTDDELAWTDLPVMLDLGDQGVAYEASDQGSR